ncbi:MAG: apolipoprotein N-acyltransferase, partial [Thermodesulfobacteriota bacterium]|nr:apolipoprotein N-acyltransferase [Thermodesulfobacteriota bacterium]
MLTASFPPGKLDWIIWFALVPLLKSLDNEYPSQALRLGFITGLSHYLTLIYWIIVVLRSYGGLNLLLSICTLFLLCLYLSLYPALFSYLFCHIKGSSLAAFFAACIWVGLEYIRANVLTGFPWCLLGYTQYRHLGLIQITDLTGVYGLSFFIVLTNIIIFAIFFDNNLRKTRFFKWEILLIILIASFTMIYGHFRLTGVKAKGKESESVTIALIQGNIDQAIKWNPDYQEKTIDIYHRLTRSTHKFNPQLIIWPETSVPFFFQEETNFSFRVIQISKESGADLIFGSPAYIRRNNRTKYYNRAYLLSHDGELSGYYDKVHLVPFGEYVPLKRFFPFIHRLVPAAGDFAFGEKTAPLNPSYFSAGVLICFEVIFPELARTRAREGAGVLINLTNDAWFGMTSAPHQHLSMAVFRAVENGMPLIRAANTGISAFISSQGKIITTGGLFMEEVLIHELTLGGPSTRFYTRYGDLFALT